MKVYLVTSDGCLPCKEAEDALREYIDSGEIEIAQPEGDFAEMVGLDSVPKLVLVADKGEVIAQIPLE